MLAMIHDSLSAQSLKELWKQVTTLPRSEALSQMSEIAIMAASLLAGGTGALLHDLRVLLDDQPADEQSKLLARVQVQ